MMYSSLKWCKITSVDRDVQQKMNNAVKKLQKQLEMTGVAYFALLFIKASLVFHLLSDKPSCSSLADLKNMRVCVCMFVETS